MNRSLITWTAHKFFSRIRKKFHLRFDAHRETRTIHGSFSLQTPIVKTNMVDCSALNEETIRYLNDMYLQHRFDLLGSGWIEYNYDHSASGTEGIVWNNPLKINDYDSNGLWLEYIVPSAQLGYSRYLWSKIQYPYTPIDWSRDHKSGYRWNTKMSYLQQPIAPARGVDIKMPWELSRMQHLVRMAVFSLRMPELSDRNIREFRNQVLDFIATNPLRMGVNWTCTMDVALRVVNILIAYDLFSQIDKHHILNEDFQSVLARSVYDHAKHIYNNLEYQRHLNNNHYLANLAGLIFCGIYLSGSNRVRKWLRFAIKEFFKEIELQFFPDGVNVEGSTCYHRLSGEITVYTLALLLGHLKNIRVPQTVMHRLKAMGFFTLRIRKPNGHVAQTGDNDSGRFITLSPNGYFDNTSDNWNENFLNHDTFLAAISGILTEPEFESFKNTFPLESSFTRSLSNNRCLQMNTPLSFETDITPPPGAIKDLSLCLSYFHSLTISCTDQSFVNFDQNLTIFQYPLSGYFLFRSDRCYLLITALKQPHPLAGGHFHNDQLAIELQIDGKDIFIDPGTYVYTPFPEKRNQFRSAGYHNAPHIHGVEPNPFDPGLKGIFKRQYQTYTELIELTNCSLAIQLEYGNYQFIRRIFISSKTIRIDDYSNHPFIVDFYPFKEWSDGYGQIKQYNKPELPYLDFTEYWSF